MSARYTYGLTADSPPGSSTDSEASAALAAVEALLDELRRERAARRLLELRRRPAPRLALVVELLDEPECEDCGEPHRAPALDRATGRILCFRCFYNAHPQTLEGVA